MDSSTIDSDNFINGDSVVKIKSSSTGLYLTSVKKKNENELDDMAEDSNDSGQEDIELLEMDDDFLVRNSLDDELNNLGMDLNHTSTKIDTKIYTPMN